MSNIIQNGKGSKPRNCFSISYKDNFSEIDWGNGSQNKKVESIKDQNVSDKPINSNVDTGGRRIK